MGGAPYWAAYRLVSIAAEHWGGIDGQAAERGVNYFDLEFDRFLNAIYWWSIQRVKDQESFIRDLDLTPVGAVVTEEDLQADADGFMAFAAMVGVKPALPTGGPAPADLTSANDADERQ